MKSIGVDIIVPWEIGLLLVIVGLIIVIIGVKQSKKEINFDKIPFFKSTTKILFGSFFIILGYIQMLPLLKLS